LLEAEIRVNHSFVKTLSLSQIVLLCEEVSPCIAVLTRRDVGLPRNPPSSPLRTGLRKTQPHARASIALGDSTGSPTPMHTCTHTHTHTHTHWQVYAWQQWSLAIQVI